MAETAPKEKVGREPFIAHDCTSNGMKRLDEQTPVSPLGVGWCNDFKGRVVAVAGCCRAHESAFILYVLNPFEFAERCGCHILYVTLACLYSNCCS